MGVFSLRIAAFTSDSIVDGPGLRLTVFTQGCPHRCPGCHNPETHDPHGGREVSLDELESALVRNPLLQGLTLSGGDPFLQALPCAELARRAHRRGLDVWTYTGYRYEDLVSTDREDYAALLLESDVLVDGPFLAARRTYRAPFRGSDNQRLIDLEKTRRTGSVVLWTRPDPLSHFTVPES